MNNTMIEIERSIIGSYFDQKYYRESNADLAEYAGDLLEHFLLYGSKEMRNPHPKFPITTYVKNNPDILTLGLNPFAHYLVAANIVTPKGQPYFLTLEERDLYSALSTHFDSDYYRLVNSDLAGAEFDLLLHYIRVGWREQRNPNPFFNTKFYLDAYADISSSGINPFYHYICYGRAEGRDCCTHEQYMLARGYAPKISVIIPNYNHERFLRARVESIVNQTYRNIEIIFLDDCSTDDSISLFRSIIDEYGISAQIVINDRNSGSIFGQWQSGISRATGDLIWICESDDTCEVDFLEKIVPHFADRSVMLAFARVQFCDIQGKFLPGLDEYREAAAPGMWSTSVKMPAMKWFQGAFAERNIIPNVGGCVFRQQPIESDIWAEAKNYKIVGDWYLYIRLARTGQIAYEPSAVTYFRQHGKNTSTRSFFKDDYYHEHQKIAKALKVYCGSPNTALIRLYTNVLEHYSHFRLKSADKSSKIRNLFDVEEVLTIERSVRHIVIFIKGFETGGGEIYPINLANQLIERGFAVSMVVLSTQNENENVARRLDRRIAIYTGADVRAAGCQEFLDTIGADIIHTHYVGADFLLLSGRQKPFRQPYVVSLHGSYEVTPINEPLLLNMLRYVNRWYYLHEKNLQHFRGIPISRERFLQIPNGVAPDDRQPPFTRAELGFRPRDFIFAVASRAISEKGWSEAIKALKIAQEHVPNRRLGIMFCGDGPHLPVAIQEAGDNPSIKFLGYQERVQGIYRLANIALLPTRFLGESFPLTLTEAFLVRRPAIATDIGMIPQMIRSTAGPCGYTVPFSDDKDKYIEDLADAMVSAATDSAIAKLGANAFKSTKGFRMDDIMNLMLLEYSALLPLKDLEL